MTPTSRGEGPPWMPVSCTAVCPFPLAMSHRFTGKAATPAIANATDREPQKSSLVRPASMAPDTSSIATMEGVDNAIMLSIPGAMEAGLTNELFWGSLSVALAIAGVAAFPVNRWLIARGKGHTAVHETGIHGGPSPRLVGVIAAVAFVFGSTVLLLEVLA